MIAGQRAALAERAVARHHEGNLVLADGSADGARELSDTVRHMQSGNVRSYAAWVAIGATAVIAYMLWVGTR